MKKVIIIPDAHITTELPEAYKIAKKFIVDEQPDEIILLGDFMDVSALSAWDLDKKRNMENKRWLKEIKVANKELDFLQENSNKVTYMGGNHEDRVERYLDKNPEVEGMIEIPVLLNLKERGIKWFEYTNQQIYNTGKLYYSHGHYTNQMFAKATLLAYGCNIVVGHLHKPQTFFTTSKMSESKMCWGLGCLQGKEPAYLKGRPSNWNNGFGVAYISESSGKFSMYPVNMSNDGSFMFEGKEYQ